MQSRIVHALRVSIGLALFLAIPAPPAKAIAPACTNCLSLSLNLASDSANGTLAPNFDPDSTPYTAGFASLTLTNSTAAAVPDGLYKAWCATHGAMVPGGNQSFRMASTYTVYGSPLANRINYLLNHKSGTASDVNGALWALLGQFPAGNLTAVGQSLYNAANTLGSTFVPGPGQTIAVFLDTSLAAAQDFLIEVTNPCISLGDFVWRDNNNNGVQDNAEPGIDGVMVTLRDAGGIPIAATVTAPYVHPSSGVYRHGYYRFAGLCANTSYRIFIDTLQPALSGTLPSVALQGGNTGADSNINDAPVMVATPGGVDETIDFGFTPHVPIYVSCPSGATATQNVPYSSLIPVTGGTSPFTFSITPGALPAGLLLDAGTGAIAGTPSTAAPYSFGVQVTDSNQQTATAAGCSITVSPQPGSLNAIVYHDANGSHAPAGQAGIPGWTINVAGPGSYGYTTATLANGTIVTITNLTPGSYTVCTVPQAGWIQTSPAPLNHCQSVSVPAGGSARAELGYIPPVTVLCPSPAGLSGTPYSSAAAAAGGMAPYTFTLISGALPTGLTLNAGTGAITGTPISAGSFSFSIRVNGYGGSPGTAACSLTIHGAMTPGPFTTFTQGGWGSKPAGRNPGWLLATNFSTVYPGPPVAIGGTYKLTFTSSTAIRDFLPQGGTPSVLSSSAANPSKSAAGVFAGQVLALRLSVDFSNAGITAAGLASLRVAAGPMQGYTVAQVLDIANAVLGGNTAALPPGLTISTLNSVVDSINNNFDNGARNSGYLTY